MISRLRFVVLCCAVFSAILATTPMQEALCHDNTVKIAVLPCSDVVKTFEHFKPLTVYLEKELGIHVEAVFPENEAELEVLLKNKATDFVFHSPYRYNQIAPNIDKSTLLKSLSVEGTDFQTGYIIARKDSGMKKMTDLKGKTVIFGMECSASRWMAGKKLLADHGIDIDTDLSGYADGGCCEDICFNVSLKAADAGLVCKHYFDKKKDEHAKHAKDLIVLAETDPIPTRIFAARKDLTPEIIAKTTKALKAISRNDPQYLEMIKLTEISGFVKADPLFYETLVEN